MKTYPKVLGELDTLHLVARGWSIARYGDGEFALAAGLPIKCEKGDAELTRRLREILKQPAANCLVGIPNIWSETPKIGYWHKYADFAAPFLSPYVQYGSSFITRPDSAPWVDTPKYWSNIESLWKDKDVVLVRSGGRSFTAADMTSARSVQEIIGPSQHAWTDVEEIKAHVRDLGRIKTAILLCLGPTATVLANDLCLAGHHAIDLGHAGMFWRKHLAGEPLVRTEADKVAV